MLVLDQTHWSGVLALVSPKEEPVCPLPWELLSQEQGAEPGSKLRLSLKTVGFGGDQFT